MKYGLSDGHEHFLVKELYTFPYEQVGATGTEETHLFDSKL